MKAIIEGKEIVLKAETFKEAMLLRKLSRNDVHFEFEHMFRDAELCWGCYTKYDFPVCQCKGSEQ